MAQGWVSRGYDGNATVKERADVADKPPHHIKMVTVVEFVHGNCSRKCSINYSAEQALIFLILSGIKVFEGVGELVYFHLAFVWAQEFFVAFH